MEASRKFSDILRAKVEPIWRGELEHPFVRGLADGTLALERFQFYLRQDYAFLIEYCRVFAMAVVKARDLAAMETFASLLGETLHTEMQLHREYCSRMGIGREELEATKPAPVTHAYTGHLLNVAYDGSLADILSAVLPCQLGYAEIGTALAKGEDWKRSPYAEWIRAYSSPEFVAGAAHLRTMLDEITSQSPEHTLDRLTENFVTSSRYEFMFWEMAWTMAGWPL